MARILKKIKNFFSIKNVTNEIDDSNLHLLNDNETVELQKKLLECYEDIVIACDKYGIKPILQGGTLLGKVRHNGFIPWDDDLDIGMLRDDYEKFKDIFYDELGERYILKGPGCREGATNRFIQVFRKNTVYKTIFSNDRIPPHVYIDIFPIDNVPKNSFVRFIKGMICNALMVIGSAVDLKQTMSQNVKDSFGDSLRGKIVLNIYLITGSIFSYKSIDGWYKSIDRKIRGKHIGDHLTSATGRKHYFGEIIKYDDVVPLKQSEFCGVLAWEPNKSEKYLENLYGDFMIIPPVEKRERHYILELKL